MITLDFIRTHLASMPGITDTVEQIIESDAGYDAIIEIIKNRTGQFPCIVLEPVSVGELAVKPGGFNSSSVSLWVMDSVGGREEARQYQTKMFSLLRDIVAKLLTLKDTPQLAGWDYESIPYAVRNAGENTGYEMTLYFKEDIDLCHE